MKARLDCVMDIGEQMLVAGAEVHRVEDSVARMCAALGAVRTDVFIITSSMVVTVHGSSGTAHTETRRIVNVGTNIDRLDKLNALSRSICDGGYTPETIKKRFAEIMNEKKYPLGVEIAAFAVVALSFTVFFGGELYDAIVSCFIGALIRIFVHFSDRFLTNKVFAKFVSTFLACTLAFFAVKIGIIADIDKVMIGNIMLLIPGIGTTNALRDLFTGDSLAGTLRLFECLLLAASIAAGYFLFICTVGLL